MSFYNGFSVALYFSSIGIFHTIEKKKPVFKYLQNKTKQKRKQESFQLKSSSQKGVGGGDGKERKAIL